MYRLYFALVIRKGRKTCGSGYPRSLCFIGAGRRAADTRRIQNKGAVSSAMYVHRKLAVERVKVAVDVLKALALPIKETTIFQMVARSMLRLPSSNPMLKASNKRGVLCEMHLNKYITMFVTAVHDRSNGPSKEGTCRIQGSGTWSNAFACGSLMFLFGPM